MDLTFGTPLSQSDRLLPTLDALASPSLPLPSQWSRKKQNAMFYYSYGSLPAMRIITGFLCTFPLFTRRLDQMRKNLKIRTFGPSLARSIYFGFFTTIFYCSFVSAAQTTTTMEHASKTVWVGRYKLDLPADAAFDGALLELNGVPVSITPGYEKSQVEREALNSWKTIEKRNLDNTEHPATKDKLINGATLYSNDHQIPPRLEGEIHIKPIWRRTQSASITKRQQYQVPSKPGRKMDAKSRIRTYCIEKCKTDSQQFSGRRNH